MNGEKKGNEKRGEEGGREGGGEYRGERRTNSINKGLSVISKCFNLGRHEEKSGGKNKKKNKRKMELKEETKKSKNAAVADRLSHSHFGKKKNPPKIAPIFRHTEKKMVHGITIQKRFFSTPEKTARFLGCRTRKTTRTTTNNNKQQQTTTNSMLGSAEIRDYPLSNGKKS